MYKRVCLANNANFIYFAFLLRFGTGFSIDIIQLSHSIIYGIDMKPKSISHLATTSLKYFLTWLVTVRRPWAHACKTVFKGKVENCVQQTLTCALTKYNCEYKNKQMKLPPRGKASLSYELKQEPKDSFSKDIIFLYTCMEFIYYLSSIIK